MRVSCVVPFIAALFLLAGPGSGDAVAIETLTWEQCLREASRNHPDLQSATETVLQAEEQRAVDRGGLFPSLSVSAGGSRSGDFSGGSSSGGSDGLWSFSVNASQLVYDGGKTRRTVDSGTESVKAARFGAQLTAADTWFAVRTAFIDLLKAQSMTGLTREIADMRSRNLRLIELRYQSGREHLGSLSKARADRAQAQFEVGQADRNLELARVRLATELGRASSAPLAVSGRFTVGTDTSRLPDFERIVRDHPSYRQTTARKEASRYSLDAAKGAFNPRVSLSSSVGNSAYADLLPDRVDWQVGFDVAVPIYAGGSGRASVSKARAAYRQLDADERSSYLSLTRSLQEAWKSFCDAVDNVSVQKQFLDAAVERARIADAQYNAGLLSFNEWIIIQDGLVSSKKSYLDTRADMLTAEATWVDAKGGVLETR